MSLKGLRFTLEIDGQEPDTFAVVNFRLIQNQSYPFVMSVDVASDSFMQTAEMLLEKKATLTIWQGVIPLRYVTGVVAGFGMQENNGWQMRYHLRIEPPLWRSHSVSFCSGLSAANRSKKKIPSSAHSRARNARSLSPYCTQNSRAGWSS